MLVRTIRHRLLPLFTLSLIFMVGPLASCGGGDAPDTTVRVTTGPEVLPKSNSKPKKYQRNPKIVSYRTNDPVQI